MTTQGFFRLDNNWNADDADLADCRGFAERDVLHMPMGITEDITLGKSAAVRQVRVVSVPIVVAAGKFSSYL